MAVQTSQVDPQKKAGWCKKAFVFSCSKCQRLRCEYLTGQSPITKVEAEKNLRSRGWSKNQKVGWICPQCKNQNHQEQSTHDDR